MDRVTYSLPQSQTLQTQYLTLYNFVSAFLWLAIFGRVVLLIPLLGFERVYSGVGQFVRWTQMLAILEIGHSALGKYQNSISLLGNRYVLERPFIA